MHCGRVRLLRGGRRVNLALSTPRVCWQTLCDDVEALICILWQYYLPQKKICALSLGAALLSAADAAKDKFDFRAELATLG